jgi:hypothetical protein
VYLEVMIFKRLRLYTVSILSLVILVLCVTTTVFADVTRLSITTPLQTILSSTLSGPITIQAQGQAGSAKVLTETTDLSFTSTSGTGVFLSSTGKPVSKTMSKGTSNRTVYYSDPTLGTYMLTVTATGRTSKEVFSATQQITVASVLPPKPVSVAVSIPAKSTKVSTKATPKTSVITKKKVSKTTNVGASDSLLGTTTASVTDISASTSVATVYESISHTSAFDALFDWPGRFWSWLTHIW